MNWQKHQNLTIDNVLREQITNILKSEEWEIVLKDCEPKFEFDKLLSGLYCIVDIFDLDMIENLYTVTSRFAGFVYVFDMNFIARIKQDVKELIA